MDPAIELAKCKEAATKVCDGVGITPESVFCGQVATALLEARADAFYECACLVPEMHTDRLLGARDQLQAEVHNRRARGL